MHVPLCCYPDTLILCCQLGKGISYPSQAQGTIGSILNVNV